jgi:hypothetical protein
MIFNVDRIRSKTRTCVCQLGDLLLDTTTVQKEIRGDANSKFQTFEQSSCFFVPQRSNPRTCTGVTMHLSYQTMVDELAGVLKV